MKKIQKNTKNVSSIVLAAAIVAVIAPFLATSSQVMAECGGADTIIIQCEQGSEGPIENNGAWGILLIFIRIMTAGVGVVAVGGIAYGAILYASAGDKSDQVRKGISVIQNVVIGLVLYAAIYAILEFIIPGGIIG